MTGQYPSRMPACLAAALALAAIAAPGQEALGWGHTGHVLIGELAIIGLPPDVPVLHGEQAVFEIGELAAEADISKNAGDAGTPGKDVHDAERDPGHFMDLDDNGYVSPSPAYKEVENLKLENLLMPGQTRRDFDTMLRQNGNATQYAGYLAFNLVDQWQQIRKDFAYIRAFNAAIANPKTPASDRAYFRGERAIREKLLIRDVGYWAHFVGDASQPMHVSVHFNGWGDYPNPRGYTSAGIHAAFEGAFVRDHSARADVLAAMAPFRSCEALTGLRSCPGIEPRVKAYLRHTLSTVVPLYELTKALGNGNPWLTSTPTADQKAFVVARLAAGAAEMRDEIVDAWHSSATIAVGYPLTPVQDIESHKVVWTARNFAGD